MTSSAKSVRHFRVGRFFILFSLICTLGACQKEATLIRFAGEAQGTYYTIAYYDSLNRHLKPAIDSILADFDTVCSLWVPASEISRVNNSDSIEVTPIFADLLQKSIQMNQYTNGCFDCRVGAMVRALGFAEKEATPLSPKAIDSLRTLCQGKIWLDTINGHIILHKEFIGTAIDFNAIAQGYVVDMITDFFQRLGIHRFLIDVGGEVRGKGIKDDGSPWKVGVERPAPDKDSAPEIECVVGLQDRALVTSGSYRKYHIVDGVRYSHTIDPFTARPVTHSTLSTTVIDSTAWRADALATAFMVMGYERAMEWMAQHPEVEAAFFIYGDNKGFATTSTSTFEKLILK